MSQITSLEDNQQKAIQKTTGPCIILAGAGTGKTYTIVEKIKHIIQNNLYPTDKIVCLTFSNEAANEMRKRILPLLDSDKEPTIKTFHSFCVDMLKKHGNNINISEDFKILLPDDAKIMLHKSLKIAPILCHKYIAAIGTAKDLGIDIEELNNYVTKKMPDNKEGIEKKLENLQFMLQTLHINKESDKQQKTTLKKTIANLDSILKTKKLVQTWIAYEKLKKIKNMLDYSDLNQQALKLLKHNPDIAKEYSYIIVDEFQDTNKLQCDFLQHIAPHANITVVGDLNQSIYRFRGAYKDNLKNFKQAFSKHAIETYNLDKSYRSTNTILRVAHTLIQHNYTNKKECFPVYSAHNAEGSPIETYELNNGKEETRKIIEIIKEQLQKGTSAEEICVVFRTHQQSRMLKNSLDFEGIKYASIIKKSLLRTTPVKLTRDYLTILAKLENTTKGGEQAWWDLIYNSNFTKEDAIIISRYIKEQKTSDCLSKHMLNELVNLPLSETGTIKSRLLIKRIKDLLPFVNTPITELILRIYEIAGLKATIRNRENTLILQRFHELAQEYTALDIPDLNSFIRHLEIMDNLGIEITAPSTDNNGIRIMTGHATKGLEYQTVIVTNLAQRKFPIERMTQSLIPQELSPEIKQELSGLSEEEKPLTLKRHETENQLLEERRLCYVAFTRAKQTLILTYAKEYGGRKYFPSQFLSEIKYKRNSDITFITDDQHKYIQPQLELIPAANIQTVMRAHNPEEIVTEKPKNSIANITFSPSALQLFDECQKKYEYRYIYNMPEPAPVSWEALKIGSFIHTICEQGVKAQLNTEKAFLDLAKSLHMQQEWNFIELSDALPLIKVFFQRHKEKYNQHSLTEQKLFTELEGIKFMGIADRIDIREKKELEIIDYKTGSSNIKPKYRNWQLGFYALAAATFGTPKYLTLDMLKKEQPIEFLLDENGNAQEIHSQRTSFNLHEVKQELITAAQTILKCHQTGFTACTAEKNCSFCNEYIWNL